MVGFAFGPQALARGRCRFARSQANGGIPMSRGTGGWFAVLGGLLVWTGGASAQPGTTPRAQLGVLSTMDHPGEKKEKGADTLPPLPPAFLPDLGPLLSVTPGREGDKILPVAAQEKFDPDSSDDVFSMLIQLTPPGPQRLFRLDSEKELFERMRIERRAIRLPMELPPNEEKAAVAALPPRLWPTLSAVAEPSYLCYRRLFFEQLNFERHGWNLGILQPPLSAALFYADVLALPFYWAADPCRGYECNSGLCLPGDPTPLLWYRWRAK